MWVRRLLNWAPEGAHVCVRLPGGRIVCAGDAREGAAPLLLAIRDWPTLVRLAYDPMLAAGEAYMDGALTIERGTLDDFMAFATRVILKVRQRRRHAGFKGARAVFNSPMRSKRNVERHYDLSEKFYRLFLDADQHYSCAYFARPGLTLEEAQEAKARLIAAKLMLGSQGLRVLDIGSGWGALSLHLAAAHDAEVLGITLSKEQLLAARRRAEAAGAQNARFELMDYRSVTGRFDRIVSVGMLEHVGSRSLQTYFDMLARRLTNEGVALIHTIVRTDGGGGNNPWIEKHIFPGGWLPAVSHLVSAVERSGLVLCDLEMLRLHYAETLRHWRRRFARNRGEAAAMYGERFCRMWEFYLAGAEAGFRVGTLAVAQLQLAKRNDAVPITRDYLLEASAGADWPHLRRAG